MSLTRTHIAFLGIISLFTGIIGPGTYTGDILLSYLMTDVRWIIYAILIGLIIAFALAAIRAWKVYQFTVILIIIALIALAIMTYLGNISTIRDGMVTSGFAWGWIFLTIGALLLFWSYRRSLSDDSTGAFSDTIDTIIGMMGGFALACIAGVIILSSLSYFTHGKDDTEILSRLYGSGEIEVLSGEVKIYGSYRSLPSIRYQRGEDSLLVSSEGADGKKWEYLSKGAIASGSLKDDEIPLEINDEIYTVDMSGHVRTSSGRVILGSRTSEGHNAIIYKNNGIVEYRSENGTKTFPAYTGSISTPIILSEDNSTIIWGENRGEKQYIIRNGERIGSGYDRIRDIAVSHNGQNIMLLSLSGTETSIIRNNIVLGTLPKNSVANSYTSNGAHSIYVTEDGTTKMIMLDSSLVSKNLQDVREVFLEKNGGGSYAYFAKPIGEEKWCLFTRYKGNLCGLEGYMNPRLGADGTSIIFAGKKDGYWSIYRNTDTVIQTTGYTPTSIDFDYAFYDLTNPRAYLFIEYDATTKKYSYRKNGKRVPGVWDDVSTEVVFGYDNHILTSAKSGDTWKIIEL